MPSAASSPADPNASEQESTSDSSSGEDASPSRLPDEEAAATSSASFGDLRGAQRLHPLTLLLRVGASLPALLIVMFPILQNPNAANYVSIVLTILYGVVALPAIVLQYMRFSYRITPKQIVIQKGVLKRQNRSIPIERIQNIQTEQNLVARLFGIVKVKIETAGSSGTEGSLEYVRLGEAQKIREVVRSFQHRRAEEPAEAEATNRPETEALFGMPLQRVLLSGAFRFSLLYLAVIFSAFQLVDPESVIERFLLTEDRMEQLASIVVAHPAITIVATVVVAVLFGWMTGIVVHLARYYGFQLWLEGDKLRKRHGLFTVTEDTIPLQKAQALILRTNPLMRAFGWYELKVQTIGLDLEEEGHRVIAPFAQSGQILELAQRVRSFDLPEAFGSVSRITIRRRFIRYTAVLSAVLLPAVYFWPGGWWHLAGLALPWWGFALVPGILGWAVLQYRNHGYQVQEDGLYIRRGVLSHYLWILPLEKFHVFYTTASIFQRRLALKSLFVDTAGAATFAYPEVIDLPADEADGQLERLYRQFRALYRNRIEAVAGSPDARLAEAERPRLPVNEAS